MEGQFHECSDSAKRAGCYGPVGSETTGQGWQFAHQIQQLMGDDFEPDTLFLEESWALGVPAAIESWELRRQRQADRARESQAFRELDGLGTLSFVQPGEPGADFFSSDRTVKIARHYDADWSQQPGDSRATNTHEWPRQNWTPQPWMPPGRAAEESNPPIRIPCHWIPQGWSPWSEAPKQSETSIEQEASSMTERDARRLLGVASISSREQIKSAYRQMVNRWHPDRLEGRSVEVRQHATVRMSEINEAYRVLSVHPLAKSA